MTKNDHPPSNAFYAPILLPVIEELLGRGVAQASIEERFRRSLFELRTPFVRVPLFLSRRFWALAGTAAGEAHIGLRARRFASTQTNGMTYLCEVAPSLQAACAYFIEYFPFFSGHLRAELRSDGAGVELLLLEQGTLRCPLQARDYTLAGICNLLRRKLRFGGSNLDPILSIALPGAEPPSAAIYREALGAPVHWGEPDIAIRLDPQLFSRELVPASPMLESTLVGLLEQARCSTQATLLEDACDHIARELPAGASFQSFCSARHLTERTAARRLLAQGWRYSELVDEYRRYRALDLLAEPGLGLAEITDLLGYGDLQSFSRAFVRWHDCTPGAWRDRPGA
ncbi:AraC family transcriptional regulator [Pseudomonas schmalbachii]|uniref:AraC family transcriptional regulator ligand-binding domain-containing protein n=1 Tax=Pseudomonas schmalbachii TaxID=2816993 RepID=A0ABS3TQE3_9PSED|nr:AraC family transcriptional regulator [Pseudomonas schmalbachii]MBO3275882.1 AraC family transcriptional regulator ligand-binding domain-containing protein [Pseudomonas schmalbachii]